MASQFKPGESPGNTSVLGVLSKRDRIEEQPWAGGLRVIAGLKELDLCCCNNNASKSYFIVWAKITRTKRETQSSYGPFCKFKGVPKSFPRALYIFICSLFSMSYLILMF